MEPQSLREGTAREELARVGGLCRGARTGLTRVTWGPKPEHIIIIFYSAIIFILLSSDNIHGVMLGACYGSHDA